MVQIFLFYSLIFLLLKGDSLKKRGCKFPKYIPRSYNDASLQNLGTQLLSGLIMSAVRSGHCARLQRL